MSSGIETDFDGVPVAPLTSRDKPRRPVNDMDLIERVLRMASEDGFVLIGVREDVYRKTSGDWIERVSWDVDATVHQLIDTKCLETGGTRTYRYDRYTGPGRSVLVPRRTRQMATRWRHLHRPRSWDHDTSTKQTGEVSDGP